MIKRQSEKLDETSEPSTKLAASKSNNIRQSPYINSEEENENLESPELELDPNLNPLEAARTRGPDRNWEEKIRNIVVRSPKIPSPESQKERIAWILGILDSEKAEPEPEQVSEALRWLDELGSLIPDHNQFVASNFGHYYPAWKEMLKGVKRRSAQTVLSWLKSGFKPKWEGTKNAKKDKKQIVESMLQRVVGNQGVA
jgi:hypothetical protein